VADLMRISALDGAAGARRLGVGDGEVTVTDAAVDTEVTLGEIGDLQLQQIAAWPGSIAGVGRIAARAAGVADAPGPGRAVEAVTVNSPMESVTVNSPVESVTVNSAAEDSPAAAESPPALLRVEPLKWWLIGTPVAPLNLTVEHGTTVDLSHSRTRIRITGARAAELLGRHLPLDLREASFPVAAVAASQLHHVGVTLWRSARGYDLFIPRGYALSVWQVLLQTAAQFNAAVLPPTE